MKESNQSIKINLQNNCQNMDEVALKLNDVQK